VSVAAIVLAAGRGTRFGAEPKLLATLEGKPLVRHVAEAAVLARAEPVIVVTGHRAPAVEAGLSDLPVRTIRNDRFAEGLSTSLKAGFAALPSDCRGAIVLLADMPRIGAALIDELVKAWEQSGSPAALIPTHADQRGNPVVISTSLGPEIDRLTGDTGLGPILRQRTDIVLHPVDDRAVLEDVDTTETLAALQR
jgi:molybdenum cofactor cytidylyltransferase